MQDTCVICAVCFLLTVGSSHVSSIPSKVDVCPAATTDQDAMYLSLLLPGTVFGAIYAMAWSLRMGFRLMRCPPAQILRRRLSLPMLMTSSWASLRAMTRYKAASSRHVEIVCVSGSFFAEVTVFATGLQLLCTPAACSLVSSVQYTVQSCTLGWWKDL